MANSHLLVAGTGGITLMDHTGKDLGYPVKMRLGVLSKRLARLRAPQLIELLSMEHRPGQLAPVKTSLAPGVSIRPGHVLRTAYNQVPARFNHFLYDWRADMRHSAAELLDYLRQRRPSNGRWNLVGHSQGGLLIVIASKILGDPDAFAGLVASVTFVGMPIGGTLNAARALVNGDQMGAASSSAFKRILRTWPALYQMLPAWTALVDERGQPLPASQQFGTAAGWAPLPHVSQDLIDRHVETRSLLDRPTAMMGAGVRVAMLMAVNRKTGVAMRRTAAGPSGKDARTEDGDSLVPYGQTMQLLDAADRRYVETFASPCREHAFMLCDPAVATRVLQLQIP